MAPSEQMVISAVNALGVPYELITIDPTYADTAAFCEKYGYPLEQSGNTIIVASKKEPKKFAACVVLAHTQLDVNRRVRQLLGVAKVSFATADEMRTVTGMEVGGVTPFGLPAEWSLYVDERIMKLEWVILGSGGRGSKIKISPAVFTKLGAEIIAGLGLERSAPQLVTAPQIQFVHLDTGTANRLQVESTDQPMFGIDKELNVQFVLGYSREEFTLTLRHIAEGTIPTEPLITGKVGVEGVVQAFEDLGSPERHAKILVEPWRS